MKAHRFVTSFVLCCSFLAAAREYSGVVVDKTSGKPVEGVLVSVEHSEFYARTDQSGRFSITDPTPEGELPEPPTAISKVKLQNGRWNFQGRSLDLRSVSGVNSVSIYTTNGKKVFNGSVPSSRIVALPSMAMGIYILELHGEHGVISRSSTKLAKEATDPERLIFRHDAYLPKDSTMTHSNTDMRVELKTDERSFVFDQSKVREYRFTIDAADLSYMDTRGYREEFKPADLSFEGKEYKKIGIRYKGSDYSLPRCFFPNGDTTRGNPNKTCAKISYKLKFTEYDKEKRFYGLKKLNLHALDKDETKMHEIISYELFRDMGIHAPRVSYANVYVNNNLIGLFLAVEEIDGRFTKSRWPEYGDGNLYKEVWPKSVDAKYYLDGLKTNDDPIENANIQRMVSYYNAINSSSEQNFEQNLSSYMDFDYFLRYLVVDVAIKNWDGMRSWYWDNKKQQGNNHNYYYYEEENANGKIWIVPWDMDQALMQRDTYFDTGGGFPGFGGQPLPQWNVPTTNCGAQNVGGNSFIPPNCDKLTKLMAAVFWKRYVQLGKLFLKDLFKSERLNDKITKHSNLIDNAMQQDKNLKQGETYNSWKNDVNSLKNYLPTHASSFESYLNQ